MRSLSAVIRQAGALCFVCSVCTCFNVTLVSDGARCHIPGVTCVGKHAAGFFSASCDFGGLPANQRRRSNMLSSCTCTVAKSRHITKNMSLRQTNKKEQWPPTPKLGSCSTVMTQRAIWARPGETGGVRRPWPCKKPSTRASWACVTLPGTEAETLPGLRLELGGGRPPDAHICFTLRGSLLYFAERLFEMGAADEVRTNEGEAGLDAHVCHLHCGAPGRGQVALQSGGC